MASHYTVSYCRQRGFSCSRQFPAFQVLSLHQKTRKSELESELAAFPPIDWNLLQRRFGLVMMPALVLLFGPGFHPGLAYRKIYIPRNRSLFGNRSHKEIRAKHELVGQVSG